MAVQYTIPFQVSPDFSAQALIAHAGIEAAQGWLARFPDWPTETLIISGAPASGKSHLASTRPEGLLLWDLVERPLTSREEAEALFHLLNQVRVEGQRLLILSRQHPTQLYPDLPDLDSRLRAANHVPLEEPQEDSLREAILFKMATDHQLRFDLEVAHYIVTRLPQTLEALRLFCQLALEQHSKAELSKIAARPLIAEVEAQLG